MDDSNEHSIIPSDSIERERAVIRSESEQKYNTIAEERIAMIKTEEKREERLEESRQANRDLLTRVIQISVGSLVFLISIMVLLNFI